MISKLFQKVYYFLPLLINLVFILLLDHSLKNGFLVLIDSPVIISKIEANRSFLNLWSINNFGYANLSEIMGFYPRLLYFFLLNIGLTSKQTELTSYFAFLSLIFFSAMIFFSKTLLMLGIKKTKFASFWGAFFYTYNLMMIDIWAGGVGESVVLLLITLPIIFYILSNIIIHDFNKKNIIILGILIGLNYNYIPVTLAILIVFFIPFLIIKGSSLVKNLLNTLIIALISFLVGLCYLIPLFYLYRGVDVFSNANPSNAFVLSDLGITGILRFFFDWTIKMSWTGTNHFTLFPYYNNGLIIITAFFIWIFCFFFLLKGLKIVKNNTNRIFIFILTSIVFGIFLDKGLQQPFTGIFNFLYQKIPFFGVFRTPYSKFSYPIVILVSFLCSWSLAKSKDSLIKFCLIICIILQCFPFFSGNSLVGIKVAQQFQNIAVIPKQYLQIANIVNSDPSQGAMLIYPGSQYGTFDFQNGFGLIAQDILEQLVKRPTIYSDNTIIYTKSKEKYYQIVNKFDTYDFGKNYIKYIFIRTNLKGDNNTSDNILLVDSKIRKNDLIKLVISSSLGTLYATKNDNQENLISFHTNDQVIYPKIKKNIFGYKIEVSSDIFTKNKSVYLQINNSYDPYWILRSNMSGVSMGDDKIMDGFGNQWKITVNESFKSKNNLIEFTLFYKLQNYYLFGLIFSFILLISLIIYLFFI